MQLFKLFSIQNIILYFSFIIMIIFIFFISYKYLYLEQSIYLLTNKLNKLEIEYNNPNIYSTESNSNIMKTAEIIMNEIFTDDSVCSTKICNLNKNTYDNANVNANSNVNFNANSNVNVNANGNDNGNANANSNVNANVNTNDNSNANVNAYSNDNKKNNDITDKQSLVEIVDEIFDLKKDIDDKESIISGTTGGGGLATKKALMKLSLDKLKAKCEDRKLSTEGTKNQLADRIIVFDNSIEITDITDE